MTTVLVVVVVVMHKLLAHCLAFVRVCVRVRVRVWFHCIALFLRKSKYVVHRIYLEFGGSKSITTKHTSNKVDIWKSSICC